MFDVRIHSCGSRYSDAKKVTSQFVRGAARAVGLPITSIFSIRNKRKIQKKWLFEQFSG
jgi:hypothetical protein